MKRTRKWSFVAQEAARLSGLGLRPADIARSLGVHAATVGRWIKAGKLTRGKRAVLEVPQAPEEWAASVRLAYDLDATDDQLVTAAQAALELSRNMVEGPATRLSAMGRFQSLVKQLALVTRQAEAEKPETVKPAARVLAVRSGVDPRNVLQAVK